MVCTLKPVDPVVDRIKARSTLVALIQPTAWATQLGSHPLQTWDLIQSGQIGTMVNGAMHPSGFAAGLYETGLVAQGGVDTLVGSVELYHGFRDKNRPLQLMGGIDLISAGSSFAFALGDGGLALGINLATNLARSGLVLAQPQAYSRIQKAKTVFDAGASMASGLMKAGITPTIALGGYVGFGVLNVLYMNSQAVRGCVDRAVDWVRDHV